MGEGGESPKLGQKSITRSWSLQTHERGAVGSSDRSWRGNDVEVSETGNLGNVGNWCQTDLDLLL